MSWIAEDVPWYLVDKSVDRPWRDEDLGMSAPVRIGTYETEGEAREAAAGRLEEAATYSFIRTYHNPKTYTSAAECIRQGVDGIRISGRYHRVREV